MIILTNGKALEVQKNINIVGLIKQLSFEGVRIAIEVNLEIVPKSQYQSFIINENDKVEIIKAVGGG